MNTDNNPVELCEAYRRLVEPHIASFDYFIDEGLQRVVKRIRSVEVTHPVSERRYVIMLSNPSLGKPMNPLTRDDSPLYPRECRQMRVTYGVPLKMDVSVNDVRVSIRMGMVPIMVGCRLCSLRGATKAELYRLGEEANDFGGYFIGDGLDKVIRMLLTQRRHYVMALERTDFTKNGANFTSKATVLKCVRDDEVGSYVRCHFLKNDTVAVGISIGQYRFFLPSGILLRALSEATDRELFHQLTSICDVDDDASHFVFVAQQAEQCIAELSKYGMRTQHEAIEYLGRYYRSPLGCPDSMSDHDVGIRLLQDFIFSHLDTLSSKFDLLILMIHKLYAFCNARCSADNADSMATQEAVLPGFIFMKCMHEILRNYLSSVSKAMTRALKKSPEATDLQDIETLRKLLNTRASEVGYRLVYLIKTGRFVPHYSRDLGQSSGFSIMAERVNFLRYLAHFRAIHKGSDFTQMRTTKPRKLLPDAWGFLCPVHTPDGLPCGLLLHLTANCRVTIRRPGPYQRRVLSLCKVLVKHGLIPITSNLHPPPSPSYLKVLIDGRVVGHVASKLAIRTVNRSAPSPSTPPTVLPRRLRLAKALNLARHKGDADMDDALELDENEKQIPIDLEIGYVPPLEGGMFPGLYLYSNGGRFIREVLQINSRLCEWIGSLEQQHLSIQCPDAVKDEIISKVDYSHSELHTRNILSILAALTPFSEFNQSPRNMYQCQMAKQTMGTPCHDFQFRPETKLYRLQTPQSPICKTQRYREYDLDAYPSGTNAVVAVISYTGYDMEDAMILNKASVDRGFVRGCIYKTEHHFLMEDGQRHEKGFMAEPKTSAANKVEGVKHLPRNIPVDFYSQGAERLGIRPTEEHCHAERIDRDGLPFPGAVVHSTEAYCSTLDYERDTFHSWKLKDAETAIVDQVYTDCAHTHTPTSSALARLQVTIVGNHNKEQLSSASIRFRVDRTPIIGDKFASRAGQKGILSRMWSDIDLPYCSRTGMRPDLIINPHAFPSRMTIGMLIESITSKSAALEGCFVDCSPFQKCDEPDTVDKVEEFGDVLERSGFSRHGTETMTCGMTGEEMECDIYIGLVYYQRLRHMVSDKYQCRATGPVNAMTRQPVKGRKAGGGIRFGEMERDSVMSHGAAFVVNDRLMHSSDACIASICTKCHSLLSPVCLRNVLPESERRLLRGGGGSASLTANAGRTLCRSCDNASENIERVAIPYVAGVLIAELAAVNISVKLYTKPVTF